MVHAVLNIVTLIFQFKVSAQQLCVTLVNTETYMRKINSSAESSSPCDLLAGWCYVEDELWVELNWSVREKEIQ